MKTLTIHEAISFYSERYPEAHAVLDGDKRYSYCELNQKANQLAHYLLQFNLQPETLIAMALPRSADLIITLLAILKTGCAYLPLDANHPKKRLAYILADTKSPLLITVSTAMGSFTNFTGKILLLDQLHDVLAKESMQNPKITVQPQHLAYVIYTSGSSGSPKGVLIEHQSVLHYAKWFGNYSAVALNDRIDFSSNIIFDTAVTPTLTALMLGLEIIICTDNIKKEVGNYLHHLKQLKINVIKITPSYFKILIQEAKQHTIALPDLKSIILGGESLQSKDCLDWLTLYPKHTLFNEYGPTEATVAISQFKVTLDNIFKLGINVPIGKITDLYVCIEAGELYIEGIPLARGYLNQKELTAEKFVLDERTQKRRYKTGDLCRFLPNGDIEYIGRMDEQVKIRGFRIEPGEVATMLAMHPKIREVHVKADTNLNDEKQLIAYYIPKTKVIPSSQELRDYLQQRLADYMIPAMFIKLDQFPLTENGKIDNKALLLKRENHGGNTPKTALEQLLAIWQKEFYPQSVDLESHFFELGGHSLIAARILVKIEEIFGKRIRLEDLYQFPTIRQLSAVIKEAEESHQELTTKYEKIDEKSILPLSDFQLMFWISGIFESKVKKINIIARRRIRGELDRQAFLAALTWVSARHEILSYRISTFFPGQYEKKRHGLQFIEKNISNLDDEKEEETLLASLDELNQHARWYKHMLLMIVKLFYLKNHQTELQICLPHSIFDDASEQVIFNDLSQAYLYYKTIGKLPPDYLPAQYKNYVLYERNHLNQHLERDICFWQSYLQDTALLRLPKNEIIKKMGKKSYSNYINVASSVVKKAQQICMKSSVSITDLLCAAVTLALKRVAEHLNNKIYINIIRSVRDHDIHEKMIGCFLRLDPIKVDVKTSLNLIALAKEIQKSRIETEAYQSCSGMIKLACLNHVYRKQFIRQFFLDAFFNLYYYMFRKFKLNLTMLMMYGRLSALRTKDQFLVEINMLNNFISSHQDLNLFGFKLERTRLHKHDLLNIDNVLDISFMRNETLDQTYLVISSNLKEDFRKRIGYEIMNVIACYEASSSIAAI